MDEAPLKLAAADTEWSATQWQRRLVKSGMRSHLKPAEAAVVDVLLAHANHGGLAWPTVPTMARLTSKSERAVQYALKGLRALGLIKLDRGGGRRASTYRFCWTGWRRPAAPEVQPEPTAPADPEPEVSGAVHCTPAVQPASPQGCSPLHPSGATHCTAAVQPASPQRCNPLHPKGSMEGHHERNDDDENQRREPQGLFDPDVVVVLLGELAKPPDGCDGWAGDVAQADARRLIDRFGPDLVRRALKFNRARVARGRFNRARHSFRGAVVRYCEAAQRGEPWADDRAEAQARDARRRAAAEASARRQANAAQREADALAEAEARDELLWSQLDPAQRASMHQAVVGRFPHLARLGQDSPLIRRQIVAELRRTAAG